MSKKKDYISWNEYFMEIALLFAKRSKDPSTQVGACIVNDENKIVGIGYNGLPNGISDDDLTWERNGSFFWIQNMLTYVTLKMNAIMNCTQLPKGCTIYVTLFPCNECAKLIIQSGIKKVIYLENSIKASTILKKVIYLYYKQFFYNYHI